MEINALERLHFTCGSDDSQSFKANRNRIVVICELQRRTLLSSGYVGVRELTRYVFPPGAYSFSQFHAFTTRCLDAYLSGEPFPVPPGEKTRGGARLGKPTLAVARGKAPASSPSAGRTVAPLRATKPLTARAR